MVVLQPYPLLLSTAQATEAGIATTGATGLNDGIREIGGVGKADTSIDGQLNRFIAITCTCHFFIDIIRGRYRCIIIIGIIHFPLLAG